MTKDEFLMIKTEGEYFERRKELSDLDLNDTDIRNHFKEIFKRNQNSARNGIIYDHIYKENPNKKGDKDG